jgi:hypothetical protein
VCTSAVELPALIVRLQAWRFSQYFALGNSAASVVWNNDDVGRLQQILKYTKYI